MEKTKIKKAIQNSAKSPMLMTHVVLGYPTLSKSVEIVLAMAESGADFIELQLPFSDPMADGPTIMEANQIALSQGVTPADCFNALLQITKKTDLPILVMTYYNLVFAHRGGVDGFLSAASCAGASGIIVPDIPPEESADGFFETCKTRGISNIPLVSPLSTDKRLEKISAASPDADFVYCVSTLGTTGAREKLSAELSPYLARVRKHFSSPLALGFGISNREQVVAAGVLAEIAIVGSAMIDAIRSADFRQEEKIVSEFTRRLSGNLS